MCDENKPQSSRPKNIPKCEQEIVAIMKQMGITEYEPETIAKLKDFVYKQSTAVLENAQIYAKNSKKETPDVDDVKLALQGTTFSTPPPQEVLRDCANKINHSCLPPIRPRYGLRLPPNRYCVSSCNYALKRCKQEKPNSNYSDSSQESAAKVSTEFNVSCEKKDSIEVTKQARTIPKPVTNVAATVPETEKTTVEPKVPIQIVRKSDMKVSTELNVSSVKKDLTEVTKQAIIVSKPVTNVAEIVPVTEKTTLELKIPTQSARKSNMKVSTKLNVSYVKQDPIKFTMHPITIIKPTTNIAETVPVTAKTTLEPKIPIQIARESATKVSPVLNVSYMKKNPTELTKQAIIVSKPVTNVAATVPVTEKTTLELKVPTQIARQSAIKVPLEFNVSYVKRDPIKGKNLPIILSKPVTNVAAAIPVTQKMTLKPEIPIQIARESTINFPTELNVSYVKRDPIKVSNLPKILPKPVTNVASTVPVTQKTTLESKIPTQIARQSTIKVPTNFNVGYMKKNPIEVARHSTISQTPVTKVATAVQPTQKTTLESKIPIEIARQRAIKVPTNFNVSYVKRDLIEVTRQSIINPKPVTNIATTVLETQKTALKPKIPIQSQKVQIVSTSGVPMEVELLLGTNTEDDENM